MCASGIQCKADFFFFLNTTSHSAFQLERIKCIVNYKYFDLFLAVWVLLVPLLLFFLHSCFLLDWLKCYICLVLGTSFLFNRLENIIHYILIFMIIVFEILNWWTEYVILHSYFKKYNFFNSLIPVNLLPSYMLLFNFIFFYTLI